MIAVSNLEFLEAAFADLPDDCAAAVCGFPGDPNDETADRRWKWAAYPWAHGKPLPACIGPSTNNYAVISSFRRNDAGEYRRRKDQFSRIHMCMVDDLGSKIDIAKQRLPPSARIETSSNNHQDFLFIKPTAAADNGAIAARLLEQLVKKGLASGGVDPGMLGVTRYGRLPVGINGKAKVVAALGHPFRTRIVRWNPSVRYTIEEIASAYALDLTPTRMPARAATPLPPGIMTNRMTQFDMMMQVISEAGLYLSSHGAWHSIECPWSDQHSAGITGTAISVPSDTNNWAGGFKCHHGHCERRTIRDIYLFAREYRRLTDEGKRHDA